MPFIVTRGHFRSRDKDSGHIIRSAVAEKPMRQANFMDACFTEPELLPIEVSHCENRDFGPFVGSCDHFVAHVTLILTR